MQRTPLIPLGAAGAALALALAVPAPAVAAIVPDPLVVSSDDSSISLAPIGSFESGDFDKSAAEIVEYYAAGKRLFVVDALAGAVQVLDLTNPAAPSDDGFVRAAGAAIAGGGTIPEGSSINSVSVRPDGLVAAAVQAPKKTDPGWVLFLDGDSLQNLGAVTVGALPDMVTFTPDGTHVLAAGEGEPAGDYSSDPLGTIGIVSTGAGKTAPGASSVTIADFRSFEGRLPEGVRVFGPEVGGGDYDARNLEPEYIAVSADSTTAWATLQENNALATIDLATRTITEVTPFGVKDWSEFVDGGFDASDRDSAIRLQPWPVVGMYQPDAIASFTSGGSDYLVTANEGDAREWTDSTVPALKYTESARVGSVNLCPSVTGTGVDGAPLDAAALKQPANLGRLAISQAEGFDAANNCYSELHAFGARSFSVWNADGELVWDSADDFERITAAALPGFFNASNDNNSLDNRSDDKGPEPEGITVGAVNGRTYAFIGFERVGGIAVYDITDAEAPVFQTYVNNRDFTKTIDEENGNPAAGDLGPEGLTFISASESPTGVPLLAVGNEVSGSTTLFQATSLLPPAVDRPSAQPTGNNPTGKQPTGTTPTGQLADTGSDPAPAGLIAVGAFILGALAVGVARRRRDLSTR